MDIQETDHTYTRGITWIEEQSHATQLIYSLMYDNEYTCAYSVMLTLSRKLHIQIIITEFNTV